MPNGRVDNLLKMYKFMYMARKSEERLIELYRQGVVKGTVTSGTGNEAAIVGAVNALDTEIDICNFMQRDFAGYLAWGIPLYQMISQYVANQDSPTSGKDGNVHHGVPEKGLLPMVSHLGAMLPNVVGAVYARRRRSLSSIGLAIIGDGGTSTGDFHESVNIASVLDVPVLFFIENNQWAYSTPNKLQFNCEDLSSRAAGYGIQGRRIKAVDPELVSATVAEITEQIRRTGKPYILQTDTYRLAGHAAYDTGEYVPKEEFSRWQAEDPVPLTRERLAGEIGLHEVESLETEIDTFVGDEINRALQSGKLDAAAVNWDVYSGGNTPRKLPKKELSGVTPLQAVNEALDHLLGNDETVFLVGEDIGAFGGPFKATKGLFDKYGRERVIDMPLAESGFTGFAIGAAEVGFRPVVEMQFSDFSTDAVTQIGVNGGSFFFRTGTPLPVTIRMPGGGGLSYGPFHSEDFEGLFATFPGLKIVYPSVVEDYFELLISSVYDDNPVLFFENKYLQRRLKGDVNFDGDVRPLTGAKIWKEGADLTLLAYGAMFHESLEAVSAAEWELGISVEVIDPRILKPLDWDTILESVKKTHRFLVVHESWWTCGMGSWIASGVAERGFFDLDAPPQVLSAPDLPIPFAPELEAKYRPGVEDISRRIRTVIEM